MHDLLQTRLQSGPNPIAPIGSILPSCLAPPRTIAPRQACGAGVRGGARASVMQE